MPQTTGMAGFSAFSVTSGKAKIASNCGLCTSCEAGIPSLDEVTYNSCLYTFFKYLCYPN
jgi:hypothetical protein